MRELRELRRRSAFITLFSKRAVMEYSSFSERTCLWAAKLATISKGPSLCRIVHGGGKIFFHEVVDHHKQGVSAKELEEAMGLDTDSFTLPGYYPVSHAIEMKLRSHSDS